MAMAMVLQEYPWTEQQAKQFNFGQAKGFASYHGRL
jgi:hypothetical protein